MNTPNESAYDFYYAQAMMEGVNAKEASEYAIQRASNPGRDFYSHMLAQAR